MPVVIVVEDGSGSNDDHQPLRVRFLAADMPLPAVQTQAIRLSRALDLHGGPGIDSRLTLVPCSPFRSRFVWDLEALAKDCDVMIVVKSQLIPGFDAVVQDLGAVLHDNDVVLVSHPCDGYDEQLGAASDLFTTSIANFALAVSRRQAGDLATVCGESSVHYIGHASRLDREAPPRTPRPAVRTVLWENPVHYNPGMDDTYDPGRHRELEALIRAICRARGADLHIAAAWYPPPTDEEWMQMAASADVAVECKALDRSHTPAQLQKPAVKVLNYMAMGLPVICDSLPAYRELDEAGDFLLFADSLEEWRSRLELLFDDPGVRADLGAKARVAARSHTIESVAGRLAAAVHAMTSSRSRSRGGKRRLF